MKRWMFCALLTTTIAAACGGTEPKTDESNEDEAGAVREILPEGYSRASGARFSPDGERLAFIAHLSQDEAHLVTSDLEGGAVEVLMEGGLSYLSTVAWTPEGDEIFFTGDDGIQRIPVEGGEPVVVIDQFAAVNVDLAPDMSTVSWSANGTPELKTAPLGEEPIPGSEWIIGPAGSAARFGPDSETLVYVVEEGFAIGPATGEDAELIEAPTDYLSNADWIDSETLLGLTDDGVIEIDRASGAVILRHEQFATMELDVSPDGSRYVFGINGRNTLQIGELPR